MKKGAYLYDAKNQELKLVADGDYRGMVAGRQANFSNAPVFLVLISDISRFRGDDKNGKLNMAAMDAGIVSQNIAIFCASVDLQTRPRATMDTDKLRTTLKLTENQYPMLNNPVSYLQKK
jgi:nitroreductase